MIKKKIAQNKKLPKISISPTLFVNKMSKNSVDSSSSSYSSEASLNFQHSTAANQYTDWEIYRMQELYEIFQREEYKKYAVAHGKFDATKEFDEKAFSRAAILVASNETTYEEIEEIIQQKIDQIIDAEKFTEEELQEINEFEEQQSLESGTNNSNSREGDLPFLQVTDANLEPLRTIAGRERYYDVEQNFFKEIRQSIVTASQSDVDALPKIFARFLNEFNDDLNGEDLDICNPDLYKDLMNRQRTFIFKAATLLDPNIRQQVVIEALKQSGSDLHLQENFVRLISKPMIRLKCNEVMAFLENPEQQNLTQNSSESSPTGLSTETSGHPRTTAATQLKITNIEREGV